MKALFIFLTVFLLMTGTVYSSDKQIGGGDSTKVMVGMEGHRAYIYPVVRVTTEHGGGSGTIIYSKKLDGSDTYSTYILTNYHVVADAISIEESWDSILSKKIPVERLSVVYIEQFKYQNVSIPVGTLRIEADIKIYNELEDMALLKLRSDELTTTVVKLPLVENTTDYKVLDRSIAVGCSLLFPPLPTVGIITRMGFLINSQPYNMSSSQIIYGNSGGAMFKLDGTLIGIPSMLAVTGWMGNIPITHMGLFIPIERVYNWLNREYYTFIYDSSLNEVTFLKLREKEIKEKRKAQK